MKSKILILSLFCSVVAFSQTSVRGEGDSQAKIDALRKQNTLLKNQLIAMLNPSQASLNKEFVEGVKESNKILKEHFNPSPVLNTSMLNIGSSKFQAQSELGKFIRGTQDLKKSLNYHAYIAYNKLYVGTNPESLFDGKNLSQGGNKLISTLAKMMKEDKDFVLNIQRCEIKNTDSKKESKENERLEALVQALKSKVTNFDDRVSVSQVSSVDIKHKKKSEINVDEYNFILSH